MERRYWMYFCKYRNICALKLVIWNWYGRFYHRSFNKTKKNLIRKLVGNFFLHEMLKQKTNIAEDSNKENKSLS